MVRYKGTSVCFTGHRPDAFGSYDENTELIIIMKKALDDMINNAIHLGYTTFISGMAIGVDIWAAEAVLKAKKDNPYIKLVCAVPFKGQEMKWPYVTQKRYWHITDNADEVVIVSEGGYSPARMQTRNEWMVDNSSIVIGIWNGSSGGTNNCIQYAKRNDATMWIINPKDYTDD